MEDCVAEWQMHCLLGVHPHPPAANFGSNGAGPRGEDGGNLYALLQFDETETDVTYHLVSLT